MADIRQIVLCISPYISLQEGLEFVLQRFTNAEFTLIAEVGREIPEEYKGKIKVLTSLLRRTPGDIFELVKGIRKTRYDIAVCIGNFLPYLWFMYFTGAKEKIFFQDIERETGIKKIRLICLIWEIPLILILWLGTLPIIFFLMIVFQIEGLLTKNVRRPKQSDVPPVDGLQPPVSVVIPNYNGRELLSECLPSVIDAVSKAPSGSEVVVVDDGSSDDSVKFLLEKLPRVKVIPLKVHQGFGKACNIGVSSAENRIVVLLNSDVIVKEDFLLKLAEHFVNEKVFAVQPKILAWDEKNLNGGLNIPKMIYGYFLIENEADHQRLGYVNEPCPSFYAIGGAMAFDKVKWQMLGGFDSLYAPFCWEDIDISYRAWKRGWKVLYEPGSKVIHKHHATISKVFKPSYKRQIEHRNEMLFTWKNLYDTDKITQHFLFLPGHILYRLFIKGNTDYALSLLRAVVKIVYILKQRMKEKKYAVVSDREVIQEVTDSYKHWHCKQRIKPRILVLTPFLPYPPSDGGKIRVYTLMKYLSDKYDFHLLSFIEDTEQTRHLPELKRVCKTVDFVLRVVEHKSILSLFKDRFSLPFHYVGFNTSAMKNKLREILRLHQPDIIQVEFSLMSPYLALCKEFPSIYVEHDVSIISGNSYNPSFSGWKRAIDYIDKYRALRVEKKSGKTANCVITVTDADRQILKKHVLEARIETVATGTDLEHFLREYKEVTNHNIVFVGSMGHFPNVDAVLYFAAEIFPNIKEEFPEATLTIVGSGNNPKVSALAEDTSVKVTGYVEDVRPYIERAEVFVAPMRRGAGIKGKLLEAMAMSKPIVTTSIGAQGIGIEPEKDFLQADTPEQFVKQIIRLFRAPDLKRKLVVSANKICQERYDWKIKASQMEEIYESLLEKSRWGI